MAGRKSPSRSPRQRRPWALVVLATAALSAAAGCSDAKGGSAGRLTPKSTTDLDGVTVPTGFNLVDKMTEDYESGAQRTARHEYRGFESPQNVRNFYREQMPLMGWTRVSDQNVKGTITIRFEKRSEACTVQIEPGWMNYTTIRVIIQPFNRVTSEPPKRSMP